MEIHAKGEFSVSDADYRQSSLRAPYLHSEDIKAASVFSGVAKLCHHLVSQKKDEKIHLDIWIDRLENGATRLWIASREAEHAGQANEVTRMIASVGKIHVTKAKDACTPVVASFDDLDSMEKVVMTLGRLHWGKLKTSESQRG